MRPVRQGIDTYHERNKNIRHTEQSLLLAASLHVVCSHKTEVGSPFPHHVPLHVKPEHFEQLVHERHHRLDRVNQETHIS